MKICIDAGHYGKYNRSPVVPSYYESDMNWKLHLMLKEELLKRGFEVTTTRALKAYDLEVTARGRKAAGCDLFISLHSNSSDNPNDAYPMGIPLIPDDSTKIDEESRKIAELLAKRVREVMNTNQSEVIYIRKGADRNGDGKADNYYGVLHGAHSVGVPAVIIEHGFHTNKAQAEWLLEDSNLRKLAVAEAEVLASYYKVTPSVPIPDVTYKVKTANTGWLPEVKNLDDYAGYLQYPITDVAVKVGSDKIRYRVHVLGGKWLPYVTGYNTQDHNNGYAGNGKPIDAIQILHSGGKRIKYRVAVVGREYYPWQYEAETSNGQDGYAGAFGKKIAKLQITLE